MKLTVPRVTLLMTRSESPSFLYCKPVVSLVGLATATTLLLTAGRAAAGLLLTVNAENPGAHRLDGGAMTAFITLQIKAYRGGGGGGTKNETRCKYQKNLDENKSLERDRSSKRVYVCSLVVRPSLSGEQKWNAKRPN